MCSFTKGRAFTSSPQRQRFSITFATVTYRRLGDAGPREGVRAFGDSVAGMFRYAGSEIDTRRLVGT
jgi:hypothetical protein